MIKSPFKSFFSPKRVSWKLNAGYSILLICLYLLFFSLLSMINWKLVGEKGLFLAIASFPILAYILAQVLFSQLYRPRPTVKHHSTVFRNMPRPKVAAILTMYNEEGRMVKEAVNGLLHQKTPVDEIYVVDDGSHDLSGYKTVLKLKRAWESSHAQVSSDSIAISEKANHNLKWKIHRFPINQGKRHAQAWALRQTDADIIVTMDMDSVLQAEAIEQLIQPFFQQNVMAVAGDIGVTMKKKNLLTRLTDFHYQYLFRTECAAHSATGHLLYCSGPLAAYRREVIIDHLHEYVNQRFMGKPIQMGDDRFLTGLANRLGHTVYQSTARCQTQIPERWSSFIQQQLRWARSFIIESMTALKTYATMKKAAPFLWTLGELFTGPIFAVAFLLDMVLNSGQMGWSLLLYYLGYISLFAYLRNMGSLFSDAKRYLWMSPLHGLLQFGLMTWIRMYALFTLRTTAWGNR